MERRDFLIGTGSISVGFVAARSLTTVPSAEGRYVAFVDRYGARTADQLVENDYDIVVEGIYVEGERFPDSGQAYAEALFDAHGIDLLWIDRTEPIPRETFSRHGNNVDAILGADGFVEYHLDVLSGVETLQTEYVDEYNQAFVQAYFVPGIDDEEHTDLIYGCNGDYVVGCAHAFTNAFVVAGMADPARKRWVVIHELGHTQGLDHDDRSVMQPTVPDDVSDPDFTAGEWDQLQEIHDEVM